MKEVEHEDLEDLEKAKQEFDTAIKNLSKLANKGFEFEIKVSPKNDSDVMVSLADYKFNEKVKSS